MVIHRVYITVDTNITELFYSNRIKAVKDVVKFLREHGIKNVSRQIYIKELVEKDSLVIDFKYNKPPILIQISPIEVL